MANSGRGGGADRSIYALDLVLTRVSQLDRDLALAVAFDQGSHLALSPARDVSRMLRGVLDRGAELAKARALARCLTFDADPGLALVRAREAASASDGDTVVADTPDLLALLLNLIEALRNRDAKRARRLMEQHISHNADRIIESLKQQGLWPDSPGAWLQRPPP